MKPICTDNPTYAYLAREGYAYVDKTDILLSLIREKMGSQFFLSRPRRFGKSLMISVLKCIFEGRKELFADTFIGLSDYDWPVYPVIHLDLSLAVASTPEDLQRALNALVGSLSARCGAPFDKANVPSVNFTALIEHLVTTTPHRQVVVLIDEYDAPVNGFINDPEKMTAFRDVMHQFFLVVKARVADIRFLMATGVTRFTKISLFSCLNNPTDLTMDARAARLCGYTPEEMETFLHDNIQAFADAKGWTYAETFQKLLDWYDSYRFSPDSDIRVCNPVSLGKALTTHVLMNYWESTGLASSAVMKIRANREIISDWNGMEVDRTQLDTAGEPEVPLVALLFQTGYLTIQDAFEEGTVTLKVPNYEVLDSINKGSMSQWLHEMGNIDTVAEAKRTRRTLIAKGMDFVLEKSLMACYSRIPYEWVCKDEAEAKRFFQLYCHFLGAKVKGGHESHLGRADAVLELPNGVYLFEFKYAKSSEEALKQIDERGYADAYKDDARPVWKIGCNYNPETRNLDKPVIVREVWKGRARREEGRGPTSSLQPPRSSFSMMRDETSTFSCSSSN